MKKQHIIPSDTSTVRMLEKVFVQKYPDTWQLVHDSSKMTDGASRKCFTRVYQFVINQQKKEDVGIKFFYDYRVDQAEISFDNIAYAIMGHQAEPDFDINIIDAKIKDWVKQHQPTKPWWKYV